MVFNGTTINPSPTIALTAGAEIKGGPFTAVAISDGAAVQATDALVPVGITIAETSEDVKAGDVLTAQIKDIGVWKGGAEFKAGDPLASDANGLAVKAAAGKFILGYALEDCAAKGQPVRVQITKSGYMATA